MAKRKRHRPEYGKTVDIKRQRISDASKPASSAVKQSVLEQFYPRVVTLREYLLSKLPKESKIRRRKVATAETCRHQASNAADSIEEEEAARIANVLDTTLVGVPDVKGDSTKRGNRWNAHVATQMESSEITFLGDSASSQSEVGARCQYSLLRNSFSRFLDR